MQDDVKKPPQAPAAQPANEPVAPPSPQPEAASPDASSVPENVREPEPPQSVTQQSPKHTEEHHLIPIIFTIIILAFLIVVAILADKTKIGQ